MNLPGASEMWLGTVLVDNAREEGLLILGDCERLFFDKVWASSSGDGLVVCGEPQDPLSDVVFIGQLYGWLNAGHGVHIKHDVSRIHLGHVSVTQNGKGFEIEGPRVSDISVPRLESRDNSVFDVDCSGATEGVDFGTLTVGRLTTLAGIESIGAGRLGEAKVESHGTATVPSGSTYVDVPHDLAAAPPIGAVQVTPTNSLGNASRFWVSDVTATMFRINVDVDPGATTATFGWTGKVL